MRKLERLLLSIPVILKLLKKHLIDMEEKIKEKDEAGVRASNNAHIKSLVDKINGKIAP